MTKQYIQPDEIIDAVREPMGVLYEQMYLLHFQQQHGKPIGYPGDTTPSEAIERSDTEVLMDRAKQKLKRALEQRLQEPSMMPFS